MLLQRPVLLRGLRGRRMPVSAAARSSPVPRIGLSQRDGTLVARLMAGSWRADPTPPAGLQPAGLATVTPFLLASGSAALAWSRIRAEPLLADTTAGASLHDAFRYAALDAAVQVARIAGAISTLRSAGIEPMLFKGRAAAGAYAEPACRPGGDIDLLVRPQDQDGAAALLAGQIHLLAIDIDHGHLVSPEERSELFARASHIRIGDTLVTVPSPEDHLRLLCLHALCHGVNRPVWLCDIAAWVESRRPDFDWTVALRGAERTADRLRVALGLAHRLLGMRTKGTPVEGTHVPRWAVSAVIRRWSDLRSATPPQPLRGHVHIRSRARALVVRWPPDPILETIRNDRRFSRWPRLPYHLADAARRLARYRHVPALGSARAVGEVDGLNRATDQGARA
jgi:hypothetical protein